MAPQAYSPHFMITQALINARSLETASDSAKEKARVLSSIARSKSPAPESSTPSSAEQDLQINDSTFVRNQNSGLIVASVPLSYTTHNPNTAPYSTLDPFFRRYPSNPDASKDGSSSSRALVAIADVEHLFQSLERAKESELGNGKRKEWVNLPRS